MRITSCKGLGQITIIMAGILSAIFSFRAVCWAAELKVYTFGSYETAGVIITIPPGANGNETATLEIKNADAATYSPAHHFTRYDANNMATSLFNLESNTEYNLRIKYFDPDGTPLEALAAFRTKAPFSLPVPRDVIKIFPGANSLQNAINAARPGDEIRLAPGIYGPVSIPDKIASFEMPIVIRADDPLNKPIIDGAGSGVSLRIAGSSYWVIDGLEIKNAGTGGIGAYIDYSSHIVIQNCFIHDNGEVNLLINHDFRFPTAFGNGGSHLIHNNTISKARHGIQLDNGVGPETVIRGNTILGHWDNVKLCGNEDEDLDGNYGGGRGLMENIPQVLALTGGMWGQHDTDFYDNTLSEAQDNDIELDGIGVNIRVYRNKFLSDNVQSPISIAPSMPGPFFILRNLIEGTWIEGAIKLNTASDFDNIPERNVFLYHNTFVKSGASGGRALVYLWYDLPGDHNVPVKNINFRNNIFFSQLSGKQATDAGGKSLGQVHPSFDDNLWYVPGALLSNLFEWQSGAAQLNFDSFASFQQGTSQEPHGKFADPQLDATFIPTASSPAVDTAARIAGINDLYSGTAADIGAFEFMSTAPVNNAPSVNAGADTVVTLPNALSLQGTATDDGKPTPPGAMTLNWSLVSGPGVATFSNASALSTQVSFTLPGNYVLRLSANDGEKNSSDDVSVTVNPAPVINQAPVVNAGPDQIIPWPKKSASLMGKVTDDGLPKPPGKITLKWSKVSGPGTLSFSRPTALLTNVSFSRAGTYILRLTASDGAKSSSDDIQITVNPRR